MSSALDFMAASLRSPSGLQVELNSNGSLRRMSHGATTLNLFVGNEVEGGPANLYLRAIRERTDAIALLGPRSPTRFHIDRQNQMLVGQGEWQGLRYTVTLTLGRVHPAWYWHVALENHNDAARQVDLIYVQDVALAPYDVVRLNEYYVSQYVDHTPLEDARHGHVLASRQNQPAGGRHPWCIVGSLRKAVSFASDALQVHGLDARGGDWPPVGIRNGLPGIRLQHEHSLIALQDEPIELRAGARAHAGFFGLFEPDHPAATADIDLSRVEQVLSAPEATPPEITVPPDSAAPAVSLFSATPPLAVEDLTPDDITSLFGSERRQEECDDQGRYLSFFCGESRHVVLRSKELRVLRPHGHMLRTGTHLTPDETALTSTTWMTGVFHSMLTQGHVSINRFLSTVHGYLGLFRSHGQRMFAEIEGEWRLLDVPSAYEIAPDECRWLYKHANGLIEVRSRTRHHPHAMTLEARVLSGPATRFLVSHHVAMNGDDGSTPGKALWTHEGRSIVVRAIAASDVGRRFPEGSFLLVPDAQTQLEQVGGDELLFADGRSREEPFICLITKPSRRIMLEIQGHLVLGAPEIDDTDPAAPALCLRRLEAPGTSEQARAVARLAEIADWFRHNALVHYLSPRGLEQYSGGGWGTRDVSQGPVEMLLAFGQVEPVRDLLLRVMAAQAPDGDWPQWFMFFERERSVRAGDSHGDIVFWPVLALAQYLIASGDAELLDEQVPFFEAGAVTARHTVWEHVERALQVIRERVIGGTSLAAYGHGDWNDALQPADPSMRRFMCSAWTVTLHYQTLTTLARALRVVGRETQATRFDEWAQAVQRDFQKLLIVDGVLTGYVLFEPDGPLRYILHPRDAVTGVRYSALAMIHAVLEDLLTPEQLRAHLDLLAGVLSGPDGVRLFDRPLDYHGGPQRYFQRAESATYFGREIGLMYMHAHLRYAQALAHVGDAERFFRALCQANPIGLRDIVPTATLRQANCYYSSSDAMFRDRYQASAEYERVARGAIDLEGGWRVYSSGAGIALGLILRRFLGFSFEHETLSIDPVIPATLNGLRAHIELFGKPVVVSYEIASRGCGVHSIEINGAPLRFTPGANPHRQAGARVSRQAVAERLRATGNAVKISVG